MISDPGLSSVSFHVIWRCRFLPVLETLWCSRETLLHHLIHPNLCASFFQIATDSWTLHWYPVHTTSKTKQEKGIVWLSGNVIKERAKYGNWANPPTPTLHSECGQRSKAGFFGWCVHSNPEIDLRVITNNITWSHVFFTIQFNFDSYLSSTTTVPHGF